MKKAGLFSKNKNQAVKSPDHTSPDIDNDKSGSDNDADKTVKKNSSEKSKMEIDPDSTGIDTKADKTKKEDFPSIQKNK